MASTQPETQRRNSRARLTLIQTQHRLYLTGPAFSFAVLVWMHYQMGLLALVSYLTFPDLVCLFGCVLLLACITFSQFAHISRYHFQIALGGMICGTMSVLCITLFPILAISLNVLIIVGALLYALNIISHTLLWFSLFERESIIVTILYMLFSAALGYITAWLILGLDSVRTTCALIGMVILSSLFLFHGLHKNSVAAGQDSQNIKTDRLPIGFVLISFIFSISYMYANMVNGLQSFHSLFTWDLPIASLVLMAFGFLLRKQLTLVSMFSLAAPLMIVGLLLAFFIEPHNILLFELFRIGFFTFLFFILVLYCGCAQKLNVNTFRLGCMLILGVFAGCIVGRLLYSILYMLLPDLVLQSQPVVSILLIGLLVLCTIYGSQWIYRLFGIEHSSSSLADFGAKKERGMDAEQIATCYKLSDREKEVLLLLLEGNSATQIAQEMVVAHGTIKAHIRNIYKKIGIHQRDELFALSIKERPSA